MFILTHKIQIRLASLTALLAGVVLLIAILVLGIAGSSTTSASHSARGQPLSTAHKHRFLLDLMAEFENGTRPVP